MFSSSSVLSLARQSLRRTVTASVARVGSRPSLLRPMAVAMACRGGDMVTSRYSSTAPIPDMFCRQCEQTANHEACTSVQGVCGKTAVTSACQDALIESVKSLSAWCQAARHEGIDEAKLKDANVLTLKAIFATLTNVNFDEARITEYLQQVEACKANLKTMVSTPPPEAIASLDWSSLDTPEKVAQAGATVSVPKRQAMAVNADAFSLNEICTYGLKGVCAYATHCHQLGAMDYSVMAEIHRLFALISDPSKQVSDLLPAVMNVGEVNAQVLALLDQSHANTFGNPEPSQYRTTAVEGKCILVSGHDLLDLYELLKQTEGECSGGYK